MEATQSVPPEPTYWNNLGLSQFEAEDYEGSLHSYETAINLETAKRAVEKDRSPENLSFYHKNKGLALQHLEHYDAALEEYEEAIRLNKMNAENYFNRGNVRQHQKHF